MAILGSQALSNVTRMARGQQAWNRYDNDLWHWFKHAQPLIVAGKALVPAEIPGVRSEVEYLSLAREVCKRAANGHPGTEVKLRETGVDDSKTDGGSFGQEYLVWYQPPGTARGLFLVVIDRGAHGELKTMFPPTDGYSYFQAQGGVTIH